MNQEYMYVYLNEVRKKNVRGNMNFMCIDRNWQIYFFLPFLWCPLVILLDPARVPVFVDFLPFF